ncbi:hypothetical protein DLE60_05540 [Micromonospora globispora]|uniref:Uncharacterized protein n=2 Tax=Micromonospora globispora TaxID=1450148 RepID=A0A317JTW0_9ACTN|nr:hypothetical protein [Micromonospora globispora]PWU44149.1 hypothetical protein DLJ46_27410 [Micromonospora globispora]PWU61457.1 hypothetical protein DLE60_05540 [Micromonospora globispora]RQW96140.1 hypothetical protein DKL51_13765 [Micromonospora globispora]
MVKPPGRYAALIPGLVVGGAVLLFALFTYGRAICLDAYGTTTGAEVVAVRDSRPFTVTVRPDDTGRPVKLWARSGSFEVGDTLTVTRWGGLVKDSRAFAPDETPWLAGFGAVTVAGQLFATYRIRRRAREGELYGS